MIPIREHTGEPAGELVLDPAIEEAWLQARPQGVMVEYTSRCNLRCKYCTKSNPGDELIPGRDMDMSESTLDAVIALLRAQTFREVLLAGTGESTFHENWITDFPRLITEARRANPRCYVHLNSNFALKYEDEHWAVLALLDGIVISIDTADRNSTRTVRAKSDLGLIIYNIVRFKTYCDFRGMPFPKVSVNVTLYQDAAAGLPELVTLLSALPVGHVAVSDMVETAASGMFGIRPVHAEDLARFAEAVGHIQEAIRRVQAAGTFTLQLQSSLMQRINALVAQINADGAGTAVAQARADRLSPGTTKICLQPWTRFTLAADAAVYPCCVTDMPPVASIAAGTDVQADGLNGYRMRAFRQALLLGQVPAICVGCSNAQEGSVEQLRLAVRALAAPA